MIFELLLLSFFWHVTSEPVSTAQITLFGLVKYDGGAYVPIEKPVVGEEFFILFDAVCTVDTIETPCGGLGVTVYDTDPETIYNGVPGSFDMIMGYFAQAHVFGSTGFFEILVNGGINQVFDVDNILVEVIELIIPEVTCELAEGCMHGTCESDDECLCEDSAWMGENCDCLGEWDCETDSFTTINAAVGGAAFNAPFGETSRRDVDATSTVRSMCINGYWGMLIDADYKVHTWGVSAYNKYLKTDTEKEDAVEVDFDFDGLVPRKVVCTKSAVFVLAFDPMTDNNTVYFMGVSEFFEIEAMMNEIEEFTASSTLSSVFDIYTSYHSLYVVNMDYSVVSIGYNRHGALGAALDPVAEEYSNTYVPLVGAFPADIYPSIVPVQYGVFLKYVVSEFNVRYFYAGIDHPSTGVDENTCVEVDFDQGLAGSKSELENEDWIDFYGKLNDGCHFFITNANHNNEGEKKSRIYVAGNPSCDQYGLHVFQDYPYPTEISVEGYGEFDQTERVMFFECEYACYIVTNKNMYVFGRSNDGIGFGVTCPNDNCYSIKRIGSEYAFAVPGMGNTRVEAQTFIPHYKGLIFGRPENFMLDEETYFFPPELVFPETGMEDNVLTLRVRKPAVQFQMDPHLDFEGGTGMVDLQCVYPALGLSEWSVWYENGFDYYELALHWETFRGACDFEYTSYDNYDDYHARLRFTEKFYRGAESAKTVIRDEHFLFDIHVRFPKTVLKSEITVEQDEFVDYWDAYVVEKAFDRATRKGFVKFITRTRYPNYLVFSPVKKNRLGVLDPFEPNYFVPFDHVFYVEEEGGNNLPPGADVDLLCDRKNCYQTHILFFEIISDYRVCNVPTTTIPIIWTQDCDDDHQDHSDCVQERREVVFNLVVGIDNLCGGEFIENIDAEHTLLLFQDWTYTIEYESDHVFSLGDWLYFVAEVSSEQVTVTGTQFDTIKIEDVSREVGSSTTILESPGEFITALGHDCQLIVDELSTFDDRRGFHFKLHNKLLNLQPAEEEEFNVVVMLHVMYEGNVAPVIATDGRRQKTDTVLSTYTEDTFTLRIKNVKAERTSTLPYFIAVIALVLVAIFVGAFALGFSGLYFVTVAKKKNLEIVDKVVQDDPDEQLEQVLLTQNDEESKPLKV